MPCSQYARQTRLGSPKYSCIMLDGMLYGVFALFGLQTIAAGVGWVFDKWRTFQDLKDWMDQEDEVEPNKE